MMPFKSSQRVQVTGALMIFSMACWLYWRGGFHTSWKHTCPPCPWQASRHLYPSEQPCILCVSVRGVEPASGLVLNTLIYCPLLFQSYKLMRTSALQALPTASLIQHPLQILWSMHQAPSACMHKLQYYYDVKTVQESQVLICHPDLIWCWE